jgi:protein-L-isoaspartate O-methyltransferase
MSAEQRAVDIKDRLRDAGYRFDDEACVWARPESEPRTHPDADSVEDRLLEAVSACSDRSLHSAEIARAIVDAESRYHLSAMRARVLRPIEHDLGEIVLELGAGCGSLTRFVGESGRCVVAVEETYTRARICALRCEDQDNVLVVCDHVAQFRPALRFDSVLLVGTLEHAPVILPDADDPCGSLLQHARTMLSDHGRIVVSIGNKLGAKYLAGAPDDHFGRPFAGVNAEYRSGTPVTFGRVELEDLVLASGFRSVESFAVYPDYKLPVSIIHIEGCRHLAPDTLSGILQLSARMDARQFTPIYSFERLIDSTARNRLTLELANSLLLVASSREAIRSRRPLAWHFSGDRRPHLSKITTFDLDATGHEVHVHRERLTAGESASVDGGRAFVQYIVPDEILIPGKLWTSVLIEIMNRPGWPLRDLVDWMNVWIDAIEREFAITQIRQKTLDDRLPEAAFDAAPLNLIVCADGSTRFFDLEWHPDPPATLGHVLFRGLLYSLQLPTSCAEPKLGSPTSMDEWILALLREAGWAVEADQLVRWWDDEEAFQMSVSTHRKHIGRSFLNAWRLPTRDGLSAIERLRHEFYLSRQHTHNLEVALSETRTSALRFEDLYQKTQAHVSNLEARLDADRAELERFRNAFIEANEARTSLTAQLGTVSNDLAQARHQLDAWRRDRSELSTRVRSLRREVVLEPLAGLAYDESVAEYPWVATQSRPQFRLHGLVAHRGRWVELTIPLSLDREQANESPVLYFDLAAGADPMALRLPRPDKVSGASTFVFLIPPDTKHVRLEPTTQLCRLRIDRVSVRKVSRFGAAAKMLAAVAAAGSVAELVRRSTRKEDSALLLGNLRIQLVKLYHELVADARES